MTSSKPMPSVRKFMTFAPHTIGKTIPLKTALDIVREFRIRFLPVCENGRVVGVLHDRDAKLAAEVNGSRLTVENVMDTRPYTVLADTPLDVVVTEMARYRHPCAIVQQPDGRVVGVFGASEGLQVLGEFLRQIFNTENTDEEALQREA